MGVAACKGMGKTFLLKVKRMKLAEELGLSAIFLPKDQLVDTPGPIILDKMHVSFLSSYSNWISIWMSCFAIYILSLEEIKESFPIQEFDELDANIKKLINCKNTGVFHVLSRVLNYKSKEELRIITQSSGLLFALLQQIHRPIYYFIDKIEEPFNRGFYKIPGSTTSAEGRYNSSIWAYSQLSFAEVVYILAAGRHHIKAFYGIRQEALYGGEVISSEYKKFSGEMISKLEYSFEDLKKMFSIYVKAESPKNLYNSSLSDENPVEALCGVREIPHRTGNIETAWAYVYRHSLQRPRDIMEMGMTLFEDITCKNTVQVIDKLELVRSFRKLVNQISTQQCREYLSGLEPFMTLDENIAFTKAVFKFLKNLPTNVFTTKSILEYCHCANSQNDMQDCVNCSEIHYFSSLYNIGLLGFIYKSNSEDGYKNKINPLGDSVYNRSFQTLPPAELYYMHPGLSNIIEEERGKANLKYYPSLFVINSSEIFANVEQIEMLQIFCNALLGNEGNNRVFLTSTGRDFEDQRKKIKLILERAGYEVVGYEFSDFPEMDKHDSHYKGETHDHCIDCVLTCKHLIYIFGGRFGGTYSGKRYQQFIEKKSSVIKIQPSVSFMEYLIAKEFGKNTKVYVWDKVDTARGEWIENSCPESYKSQVVENTKVFVQLKYFNELGNGTWCDRYSNEIGLEEFIAKHFPNISKD